MEMMEGQVLTCHADDCSYNCDARCCAANVEIGAEHPMCDMYTTAPVEISKLEPSVDKCMVSDCHFNTQMSCGATGITLTPHADHADCVTFRM